MFGKIEAALITFKVFPKYEIVEMEWWSFQRKARL